MVRSLLLVGVVATTGGACTNDGSPASPPPAGDGAPDVAADTPADGKPEADQPDDGKSGLTDLTRAVVEDARRSVTEPLRLIPSGAHFIGQFRVGPTLAYPPTAKLWEEGEKKQVEFGIAMDVLRTCLGSLETIEDISFGFDSESHLVVVGRGKGLGTQEQWRCFERTTIAKDKEFDFVFTGTAQDQGPQLMSSDDPGFFVGDDTVVLIDGDWRTEFEALRAGTRKPAIEGPLAAAVARVNTESPFWMAGLSEGPLVAALDDGALHEMEDFTFAMQIEDDQLRVAINADAGQPSDAKAARDELQHTFDEFKAVLPTLGLSSSFSSRVKFEVEGDEVSVAMSFEPSEIESMRTTLEGLF
ncbi:MAG: hypothetical protein K0V04_42025 [Deltaproteobacteria bacterium]|nr:hypothetical protein [Deltaproteobacteria bacterium]